MSEQSISITSTAVIKQRKYRSTIPDSHRGSLDTRLLWLWHQRFGTVQTIYLHSKDVLDHTACTLVLQAIMGKDLESIYQLLTRLEGGPLPDDEVLAKAETEIRV